MDANLTRDPEACQIIRQNLAKYMASSPEDTDWDDLKNQWKDILIDAGRNRKVNLTAKLNEISRRILIIERGGDLTFCTQEYLSDMRDRYREIMKELKQGLNQPIGLQGQQSIIAGSIQHEGNQTRAKINIRQIRSHKGNIITDQTAIEKIFVDHFQEILQENADQPEPTTYSWLPRLPQLKDEDASLLYAPITKEEALRVIRSMNKESAPDRTESVLVFTMSSFPR